MAVGSQRNVELLDSMPRLLNDIDLFTNMDFLAGAIGVQPTGWTGAGTGTGTKETGRSFDPVLGPGVAEGLKMVRTGAPNRRLDQQIALGNVALNEPVLFMAAVYPEGPGDADVRLDMKTLDTADADVETFEGGPGLTLAPGQWHFIARWGTPVLEAPFTTSLKWWLRIILTGTQPVNEPVWFAYAHFGIVSEFTKRLAPPFKITPRYFQRIVPGADSFQVVENAPPENEIKFSMVNVVRGGGNDAAWLRFQAEARDGKNFSLWRDSSQWLNTQDHFQRVAFVDDFTWRSKDGIEYFNIETEGHLVRDRSRYPEHVAQ